MRSRRFDTDPRVIELVATANELLAELDRLPTDGGYAADTGTQLSGRRGAILNRLADVIGLLPR